ncbi:DUF1214 domain-containing protein [Listeria monocytogenes]|uniref:DUF1214 domain-containing protein n=1 Tax=Listeria monocytogenes TaxID=1639 RepID=UPI000F127B4B|nr:DUF1214 domain-containing protein [Listeria monocytogenes]EAC3456859.1 DUF1254 domain-containing protein [Listeria monocytogenes]EAC4365880.1 DUF1254 domain-containing protein [Listeria monocytogenes]EAC4831165.1 DUF1254 domain-containing protein [Listeria monocytogenes]EAC6175412.1 DUF1254 domain-containing protein [Listeria monocytogenes]EAC6450207.1 DUF1254 domain-containing protein [Listeria monocytogenes]
MTKIYNLDLNVEDVVNSYVYILGRYLVIRQEKIDLAEKNIGYNILKHNIAVTEGSNGTTPTFVNPNLEVVYSEAWIAVDENTPVLLEIPKIPNNLYYTAQIVDEWAEIITNINRRNYPEHGFGTYAICLAGSTPKLPEGVLRIDIPSTKAKILTRIEIGSNLAQAVNLQHQFTINSIGTPKVTPVVDIKMFSNKELPGAEIFDLKLLKKALAATDACPQKEVFHPMLEKIGELIEKSVTNFDEINMCIHQQAIPKFVHFLQNFGDAVNGWSSTRAYSNFGSDYWFRATANFGGIWWNSSVEAIYNMLHVDADGITPNGSNEYTLHFEKAQLPELFVDGYWSATIYSKPAYMLVPNDISRYNLGYMSNLAYDSDGGLTLYISANKPADDKLSNWLPAPENQEFTIDLRMYLPKQDVLNGNWVVPALNLSKVGKSS